MSENINWELRFKQLVREADEICVGIYPQSVNDGKGGGYEKRTEYMEGWNACSMAFIGKFRKIAERITGKETDEESFDFLAASDAFFVDAGKLTINLNDTFAWACADGEEVPPDKIEEVASLFRRYGLHGLHYWASKQRGGERSEFKDINRGIDFVARELAWSDHCTANGLRTYYTEIPSDWTPAMNTLAAQRSAKVGEGET